MCGNILTRCGSHATAALLSCSSSLPFPPHHVQRVHPVHQPLEVSDDVPDIVVGYGSGVARPDALAAVHQHHGEDGHVPLRLNTHAVIVEVLELSVVSLGEY